MNCECNNNSNRVKPRIKHVYGNVLRMAIPLTLRTLVKDGDEMIVNDTDFIPSSDHLVRVVLSKGKTNYPIIATMDGNVAIIEDKGKIPEGTYDISVECYDDIGNPYRFKQNAVLYVADTTAEAGIDEEIEYEAQTWYLNAAVFLATTEIGEIGDVIDAKLDDVFGNVLYDANAKEIRFYNKGNSRVLATIDSRPFVVDGTVADVYIDVSRQVLVVVLNEDAGGRRFSVPLYLVFNSYYKKDEVDSLVSRKVEGVRMDFLQELPLVVPVTKNGSSISSSLDFGAIDNAIGEDGRLVVACVNNGKFYQLLNANGMEVVFSRVVALDGYQELLIVDESNEWSMEDVDLGTGGGGYEPPVGGIPKTDLAPSVQQTLDDVANKVDKETGKGLSTNDYTTEEKSKLGNLPTADQLTQQLGGKANDNAVVKSISVNGGTAQTPQNGNVNVVVPTVVLDDAPTAGSSNGVKSGGVKTALDNLLQNLHIVNGEWYIGNTATGVSAQGPAGNVNITDASQLVTILVNDLTTGGAGNILSAEMGKVIKEAVTTLLDSMGEYCFPNGRPTLSWEDGECLVTQNLTDVSSNFLPNRIDKNGSLNITLSPVDNLHVFLTGDVTVEMPLGTDITSTAWNESTGKVTIADVTDDVIITAKSSTYVQSGLVLMFDGKNQGSTSGQWKDLINSNSSMVLSGGYTKNTDNVEFDGVDGEGIMSGFATDMPWDSASLESVVSFASIPSAATFVFGFGNNHNTMIFVNKSAENNRIYLASQVKGEHSNVSSGLVSAFLDSVVGSPLFAANEVVNLSRQGTTFKLNNTALTNVNDQDSYVVVGDATSTYDASGKVFAGAFTTRLGALFAPFAGKIYCVRAYSRTLTPNEVTHNYAIDKKRFNIA